MVGPMRLGRGIRFVLLVSLSFVMESRGVLK